jgi:glutamate dehydrogenase
MLLSSNRLVERATCWFLRGAGALDIAERSGAFRPGVQSVAQHLGEVLPESQRAELARRAVHWTEQRVPLPLAQRVATLDFLVSAPDIVKLSLDSGRDLLEIARGFYALGTRFRLDLLRLAARKISAATQWQKLAIGAIIEDFYGHQAELTARSVKGSASEFETWTTAHSGELAHLEGLTDELLKSQAPDLAMLTVANRQFRALVAE